MARCVDVIVPCYNYAHYLTDCVHSALSQRDVAVRVLIIDDCSPDSTPEIGARLAEADARVTYVRHATNKRHIATFNEGLDWASQDYLLLLSADDYLLDGALLRATTLMEQAPDVGFAFGNARVLFDSGEQQVTSAFGEATGTTGTRVLPGLDFVRVCGATNMVSTPTAVVRTSLQKKVGGYRTELPHSGDLEMWFRLAAHAPVGFIDDDQAVYRIHANNMSGAYFADMLPDIEQRQMALECFFESASSLLPDENGLRTQLFGDLGQIAIGRASMAFNQGRHDLSQSLGTLALKLDPNVRRSLNWRKLAFKRAVGPKIWRALGTTRDGFAGRR